MKTRQILFTINFSLILASHFVHCVSLECYDCISDEVPDCAINPSANLSKSTCEDGVQCATAVVSGTTYRGCLTKVPPPNTWEDSRSTCNTSLCNGEIFPVNRLRCYQCENKECVHINETFIPKPCEYYKPNDECFTKVFDKNRATRNCVSYKGNGCGEFCFKCNTTGCNDHQAITNHTCVQCTHIKTIPGSQNLDCIRSENHEGTCVINNQKNCTNEVLLGRVGKCFSYSTINTVQRDCLRIAPPVDPSIVKECTGDLCNNQCLNIKCLICDSETDWKCKNQTWGVKSQTCPQDTFACHACEDVNARVVRGCGRMNFGHHCHNCRDEDGCNQKYNRNCFKCTSNQHPGCAQWTDISTLGFETCQDPKDSCVSTIGFGSTTIRGCLGSVSECTANDPWCSRCNGSMCNAGLIPAERLHCHQCKNSDECDQDHFNRNPVPCVHFQPNDGCYMYVDDNRRISRGCLSHPDYINCKRLPSGRCFECYDHGCNSRILQRTSPNACIQCNKNDSACAWSHNAQESAIRCGFDTEYFLEQGCYSHKFQGGQVERGCFLNAIECPDNAEKCDLCYNNGCNHKNYAFQSCIQCNSSIIGQETCATNTSGLEATLCLGDLQRFADRGCFIKREGNEVIRGCLGENRLRVLENCHHENVTCEICQDQNCNDKRLRNSANANRFSWFFIFVISVKSLASKQLYTIEY